MLTDILTSALLIISTIAIYQIAVVIQRKVAALWLNPMLVAIAVIIPIMLWQGTSFEFYFKHTQALSNLLEPAVVALGYPLYQHLKTIRYHWKMFASVLTLGVIIVILVSFILSMALFYIPEVAIALSYKSVTTPIGIALTDASGGNSAITAFAIILAGLFGALLGPSWLTHIGVTSAKAQGLAIGAGSHALGTSSISKISYEHGAYGSLALIVSAVITALIGPLIVDNLVLYYATAT
ncbi:LrgB family protein [Thalassotalea sp. PLHSN55]|uniref:LrgB family protein n=1 Tax=Thalassotalea sp. PLHSN55 TaxID=3435888 RepID=UPI003F85BFA8